MVLFPKDDSLSIGETVPAYIDKAQTWVCYGTIQRGGVWQKANTYDGAVFRY